MDHANGKPAAGPVLRKESAHIAAGHPLCAQYHGYFFAWATIYTFWYHPMVSTSGHLIGFLYMFMLLLQGSLFFTRIHINKWWDVCQRVRRAGSRHAGGGDAGQRHLADVCLRFWRGVHYHPDARPGAFPLVKWGLLFIYIALVLLVYSERGWDKLNEIIRIP